ncbi:hypothetical protein MHYP_G00060790 [Metynnis hypsauchen]
MPPKLHKTPGPSQSLIRPVAQATSTSTSDADCPADVSSAPVVLLDISVLRSEIVRVVVSKIRPVMDEHYSNIKTELLDMKSELLRFCNVKVRLCRSRRPNIRIVGIPEGELFTLTTSSVSELLKEASALDKPPLVDCAHHTLAPKPKSGDPPRPVIARLHYYENCVEILRKARRQQRITVSNMKLSVFPDFTAKVARA